MVLENWVVVNAYAHLGETAISSHNMIYIKQICCILKGTHSKEKWHSIFVKC